MNLGPRKMIKGAEIAQSEVIDFIGLICFGVMFGL
jgi:hypothetical protein